MSDRPPATLCQPAELCSALLAGVALRAGLMVGHMFYTYVLRSKKDGKVYVGWTIDLEKRLHNHKKGLVDATKNRLPLELIYYEACLAKEKAIAREKQLKTGFGRAYLKRRI